MNGIKYTEILKKNKELGKTLSGDKYRVAVFSNTTVSQLKEILEYTLRTAGINCYAEFGDYDNIVQDSGKFKNFSAVIIFWELANIVNGLQYKADLLDNEETEKIISKVKSEIDLVISNLKDTPLVLINKFSSLIFTYSNLEKNHLDRICCILNEYLDKKIPSNVITVDIDNIIAKISIEKSIDLRYFYSSKALYTIDFYKEYSCFIKPVFMSVTGKAKKALILDCDNTLWKGVLGEDGFDGIEMSGKTPYGTVFEEVQSIILELGKKGVLLGLCSKNNQSDIEELIEKHPDMKIKNANIVIKKINWEDKVCNLKNIAEDLNISLDSMVLVEDSVFEINFIKENLPQITVLQVPSKLEEYPRMMRENLNLFFSISKSAEDSRKIQMYKEQTKREALRCRYKNIEDYLKSLELCLTVSTGSSPVIPRISQLTQKTNQFNLTTKRYTETDIKKFIKEPAYKLFHFSAADKCGDYGITGLSIIKLDSRGKKADIDTLLMSCRVIGRNFEFAFFDFLVKYLKKMNINLITATYRKTSKNCQVAGFYENLGFKIISDKDNEKKYEIQIKDYKYRKLDYIRIKLPAGGVSK
ncbi:MAG: HAD-IIIC family phosphatase [Elusimicrobia bacterium]|nr:HAD-IIIC family phosphatase [Elusimicrobiota bacterium]